MRFTKRMAAAFLAVVMIATSVQDPGGVSYAAESVSGSMESGQEALEPLVEANSEGGSESAGEEDAVPDSEERQENSAASSEGEARPDESAAAGGANQTGEETETADTAEKTGTEETVTEGGETTETDGTVTEETDTAKAETEEAATEETDTAKAETEEAATEETDTAKAETEEATTEETDTAETETEEAATEETEPEEVAAAQTAAKAPTVNTGEVVIEADLDAIYQFGGMPSGADGITMLVNSDAEDYLYRQLLKRTEKIVMDDYPMTPAEMGDLLNTVMNEHPDLYACKGYSAINNDGIATITALYYTGYDDDAFRAKAAEALSCVSEGMSDLEKATALHDYLVVNVAYDYLGSYSLGGLPEGATYKSYGALVEGKAVCEGYALAYKYLLNQLGIECYMVGSKAMNHAWNMVKLDGKYYHVDTTWDDPVWDRAGRVFHTNLFRSDANLIDHKDWTVTSGSGTVDYKATDTTYESAFWVDSTAPLVFDGRDCYYLSPDGSLRKASFSNFRDRGTEIAHIEGKWSDGGAGWWDGVYSGLYQINGRLFYNDAASIYSIKKDGTDRKTEFTSLDTGDDDGIFGSAYCGGKILYTLHPLREGPNSAWKEEVMTIDPDNLPDIYRIYYELNGGVNCSRNPDRYTNGSKTITLKRPMKEGFRFGGWYEDQSFTRKVETIPNGSKGDITLYAKWLEGDALDVQNPGWIFTALDDRNVRSKADAKPKILFFFKTTCSYCRQESMELRDHIREFSGADIYAVEFTGGSKDVVSQFKKEYGCDEITYCYDTTWVVNNPAMWDYVRASGNDETTVDTPVVAYIDAKNRLQRVTTGYADWSEVLETLQKYCGNDDYLIHYVLKGGTNNRENPETYLSSVGVVLKDPVKAGDTFEGWYMDAWFKEKVTEIPKGTKGNVTLFAKWKSGGEGGLGLDNLDYTFWEVEYGMLLDSKADGRPKLLVFFEEEDPACQKTIRNLSKDIADFDEMDVYAIDMTPHALSNDGKLTHITEFIKTYGCDEIRFAFDNWTSPYSLDKAEAYQEAVGLKGMNLPLLCYIDKDNKLQWVSEGEQTSGAVLENLRKYCSYRAEAVYQIAYVLDGGTNHPDNPASYRFGSNIYLKDPVKEGCVFDGWYKDAGFKEWIGVIDWESVGDITLYAKWRCGLELPNLGQSYMGLDLIPIFTIAWYKPKLLVFFEEKGKESRNTIKNITAVIDSLDGVNIFAIECGNASLEEVQAFQDTYGCSEMKFAYEKDGYDDMSNAEKALAYVKAAGLPESMDYPILCYIDEDNHLQWVTKKEQTGGEVLENLRKYCWYIPGEGGQQDGSEAEFKIDLDDNTFAYNGKEHKPRVTVTAAGQNGSGTILEENTDYILSYRNNKNAGTAKVIVTGMGEYSGSAEETFTIEPAPLTIRAADRVILVGDKIPAKYEYEADGLLGLDELVKEPEFICDIVSTAKEGEYTVTPTGADAGSNYVITYENGRLTVTTEYILWKVIFDTQGHGKAPAALSGVRSGDTIDSPAEPQASGYRFDGWYRDPECKKAWNFETDIVETDITLYAKWLRVSSSGSFALQEVPDQYYTGKALKPAVSVYDGDTLLKAGRDYQVKYYNNVNANGSRKTGNGEGADFKAELPYVEITGKGNYKSTVKVNFNILKLSIGDSSMDPVAGAVLKVNDHLAKSNTALKPSVSLKIGKALKKDTDFTLELQPIHAFDASDKLLSTLAGAEIPAGATGEFKLLIKGTGNYEGSIAKQIYVADKDHLMKNAKITLGKNLKNVDYTGNPIRLTPAKENGDDVFTVRIGQKILDPETDYLVLPSEGSAGKAELVVTGIGDYVGRKTAVFNVKGKAFSNSAVDIAGITDRTYTGKAHTQNKEAVVTYKDTEGSKTLVYGTDYTINYSKNISKGKATMTFVGNPKAGYSGKVKKTFQITAVDIADINAVERAPSMRSITVSYARAGAKPVDEIILTSKSGVRLRGGKDYTLKYKGNKAVTTNATVTVTGKGNYTGKFDVTFAVTAADLSADSIVLKPAAVAFDDNKADDFVYTPAVKVMDGKAALKADRDFEIEYLKNTQKDYKDYLDKLKIGSAKDEDVPRARITAKAGSNYGLPGDIREIDVPLQIYQTKLNKADLDVRIGEAVYTGGQVIPDVTVSYNGKTLREGVDYRLTYGANCKAGKNKGSVTVNGLAPYYGGSVTYKFEINGKDLKF